MSNRKVLTELNSILRCSLKQRLQFDFDLKSINQEFLLFSKSLNKHIIRYFTIELHFKFKTKVKRKVKKNEEKIVK